MRIRRLALLIVLLPLVAAGGFVWWSREPVIAGIEPPLAFERDRPETFADRIEALAALGDEERLRSILQAWEGGPEAVQGSDPEAARQRRGRLSPTVATPIRSEGALAWLAGVP